ncbi:MAG: DUF4870 domain-containing protein [Candidatus Omnitrophica bacterium]|nr:DUF4870 domain-containing protein [Candidatus Omnitrophota bacterium]
MAETNTGLKENLAGLLCYALGWISGIVFLIVEKDNKFVRFHALQSVITFVALTVIVMMIGFIPVMGWIITPLITILGIILWLILMLKAYQGEMYKLPIVGEIVEKQLK